MFASFLAFRYDSRAGDKLAGINTLHRDNQKTSKCSFIIVIAYSICLPAGCISWRRWERLQLATTTAIFSTFTHEHKEITHFFETIQTDRKLSAPKDTCPPPPRPSPILCRVHPPPAVDSKLTLSRSPASI
jgi:hypothetical protein